MESTNTIIEVFDDNATYRTTVEIEFRSRHKYKRYAQGKAWPKITQCIITVDGLVVGIGNVIKHRADKNDDKYARMYSAKKAFEQSEQYCWKIFRPKLWERIKSL